jgi:hypothetical protein
VAVKLRGAGGLSREEGGVVKGVKGGGRCLNGNGGQDGKEGRTKGSHCERNCECMVLVSEMEQEGGNPGETSMVKSPRPIFRPALSQPLRGAPTEIESAVTHGNYQLPCPGPRMAW